MKNLLNKKVINKYCLLNYLTIFVCSLIYKEQIILINLKRFKNGSKEKKFRKSYRECSRYEPQLNAVLAVADFKHKTLNNK